jgi:hypothetical protein
VAEPDFFEDEVTAGPGGAMTDDVGVVTGDLTVLTARIDGGLAAVSVQYTGADEWYTLTGSPAPVGDDELEDYHHQVLDAIEAGHEAVAPPPP